MKMMMNICSSSSFGTQEHEEKENDDKLEHKNTKNTKMMVNQGSLLYSIVE
jgi:hypothetical protein